MILFDKTSHYFIPLGFIAIHRSFFYNHYTPSGFVHTIRQGRYQIYLAFWSKYLTNIHNKRVYEHKALSQICELLSFIDSF
ncbi:MAG: hypothetical protein JNM36_18600 [Chitinophagales bacterium]|nr:hypothetical protein [Chitinophagales bacterium]